MKRQSPRNLTRVDRPGERLHGYLVRLQVQKQRVSKWFSDFAYGGKRSTEKAAVSWRDATRRKLLRKS